MDDLRLLDDLVRADPLPTRAELVRSRTVLLDTMSRTAAPARRRVLLASLTLAGTVATAAAAGVAVAVLNSPRPPAPSPPVADASTSIDVADPTTFRLVADSSETTEATARRLSEELDAALRKTAPGARWIAVPGVHPEAGPPKIKGWELTKVPSGGQLFNGGGAVGLGDRWGSLALLVDTDAALLNCAPDQADCVASTGPGGAKMVVLTVTTPGMPTTGDPHVQRQARVALPDSRVLVVVHSNDIGPDGTPKTQWQAPLTAEQIAAIATDIAAKIKP